MWFCPYALGVTGKGYDLSANFSADQNDGFMALFNKLVQQSPNFNQLKNQPINHKPWLRAFERKNWGLEEKYAGVVIYGAVFYLRISVAKCYRHHESLEAVEGDVQVLVKG